MAGRPNDKGNKPSEEYSIDRINNNDGYYKDNCRWATKTEQMMNTRIRRDNTSGYRGVTYVRRNNNWQAQTCVDGKHIYIGVAKSPEEAYKLYLNYRSKI